MGAALTMRAVFRLSESDFEADIDTGANKQKLEHKVVYSLDKEHKVRCALGWFLSVRAEVSDSLV